MVKELKYSGNYKLYVELSFELIFQKWRNM